MKYNIIRLVLLVLLYTNSAYANHELTKSLEQNYPNTYNRHTAHQFNDDALGMLQMQYKLNYDDYILNIEENIGLDKTPVIYIEPDLTFFLLYNNEELRYYIKNDDYLNLMGIYNTAISAYLIITQTENINERNARLKTLAKLITNADKNLDNSSLSKINLSNEHKLLNANLSWVNQFIKDPHITISKLNQFTNNVKPLMEQTLKKAIKYKVDSISNIIDQIKLKTGKDTDKTMIIFRGNPFQRQNSVVKLVLEHKYKFKNDKNLSSDENSHIIYIDAWQLGYDSSIEGLANVMLDQEYASQFYDNGNILRTDFTSSYAKQYLKQIK